MATAQSKPRPSRKQGILDIFAEMVAERGYDSVSIRDVAEYLDISKGTVIHHYGSKDKLLEEVHSRYMKRRLAEIRLILPQLDTPTEQLAGMVLQNLFSMRDDHDATVAFAREIVRFASDPIMVEVREMRREYTNIMRDILARGMESGDFRREDSHILALQIFGMTNWSWTWLRTEGTWKVEDLGASFVRTIVSGIRAGNPVTDAASPTVVKIVRRAMSEIARDDPA
jgi:AcrR family transcriptional regulator